jgi:SCY1-like protein 1
VTVFSFDKTKNGGNEDRLAAARNALKRLKTLRHPGVLRYVDGVENDGTIFMVTEAVQPLPLASYSSARSSESHPAELIAWGLHQLVVRSIVTTSSAPPLFSVPGIYLPPSQLVVCAVVC